ncbi:hypothetical protein DRJ22_02990 [Candidatus Woesearchaeota archaeon]|nr:MAG: hypothetical protein DRJ22_02990 [Candidatus Woesearchaeota archaeon]
MSDEKSFVIEAILEKIKEREAELYEQKQKIISEIFERAEKENWIKDISESKFGKRFLFELAVKSCEVALSRLLPEKFESSHDINIKPLLFELRKALLGEEEEKEEEKDKNES